MTDRDMNERLLRLNAALDGELDAMASLEFEREMRDDPAIAAEYRRLTALRDAVRRHAPREAAPQALADRIAGLAPPAQPLQTAAAPATVVPLRRRAWFDRRALAMAASFAVLGFAVGAGLTSLRTPAGFRRRRPTSCFGFRPRRDRRPAVRRRLVRPAHGQALACRPHNRQRNDRRSRAGRLPAGRRTRRPSSTGSRRRRSSIATTSTSSR